MSIFSRTRDIIAANVIDLVNRSDDPAKTIRVIIMEMEETLVEVRASAARLIADSKEKSRQVAQLAGLQDNWTERAELALSKGRDDLARLALVEKEKLTDLADELNEEIAIIDQALRASEGDIAKLQAKLREARVRQNAVATRFETAQNQVRPARNVCRPAHRGGVRRLRPARPRGRPRRGPCRSPDARRAAADARGGDCRIARRRARRRRARGDEAAEDRGMTTVQVNGDDIMAVIHVVRIVGSIVMMLVVGLVILWAVRTAAPRAQPARDDRE